MADMKQARVHQSISIRSVLSPDWFGTAGMRFSKLMHAIAGYSGEQNLRDADEEALRLGARRLEDVASDEYAAAVKKFADAERLRIESELKRRSMEAEAAGSESEARFGELGVLSAEIGLVRKFKQMGVVLGHDAQGNLTILPTPTNYDYDRLAERIRAADRAPQVEEQLGSLEESLPAKSPQRQTCKHPRVQIVSRDEDAEFVECMVCHEIFESTETKDTSVEEERRQRTDL
jgi:hypothetical protein